MNVDVIVVVDCQQGSGGFFPAGTAGKRRKNFQGD